MAHPPALPPDIRTGIGIGIGIKVSLLLATSSWHQNPVNEATGLKPLSSQAEGWG